MNGFAARLRVVLCAIMIGFALTGSALAEKLVVAKYRTREPIEKVFDEAVRAITTEKYVLRLADKSQGTVQAVRMSWGSGTEYASVFISLHQSADGTSVEATFSRHPGCVGGGSPQHWAKRFEDDLKATLPDLAAE